MPPAKRARRTGKLLWAVDLLDESAPAQKAMLEFLGGWINGTGLSIEAVHVGESAASAERYLAYAAGLGAAKPPAFTAIRTAGAGLNGHVDALISYAEEQEATAVALPTLARRGLRHLVMGSFSEALVLRCPVPVITMSPKAQARPPRRLLLATDLGDASAAALPAAIAEAKLRKLSLSLVHVAQFDTVHPEAGFGPAANYETLKTGYFESARERLHAEAEVARKAGLDVEEILREDGGDPAAGILETAESLEADVIALAAQRGRLEAAFGASVTRAVMRAAPCPVWSLRPAARTGRR